MPNNQNMINRLKQFKNELSILARNYPLEFFTILIIPTIITTSSFILWVDDATRDKNELLQEKIVKLEDENKSLKLLNADMQILYNNRIIYQTEQPVNKNESVAFLNGKVILKVYEIYDESVKFEFSFEGKPQLEMDERWKEGSITNRIPFDFEGKSYFILINRLGKDNVDFSVYLKDWF